jgi:hypothetical protein
LSRKEVAGEALSKAFETNASRKCATCGYEGNGELCLWCETPMTILRVDKRTVTDRRTIERRAPKVAVNVRYEDKDQPAGWKPKRIRRGEHAREAKKNG